MSSALDQSRDQVDHQPNTEGDESDERSTISADEQQARDRLSHSAEAALKSGIKPSRQLYPDLTILSLGTESGFPHHRKPGSPHSTGQSRGPHYRTTPSTAASNRLDSPHAASPCPPQRSSAGQQEAISEGKVVWPIKWHSVLISLFVVLPLVFLWPFIWPSVSEAEGRWSRFLDKLKPVKQRHKDLHPEIWIVIESQMEILLNGSASTPEAPAIIVFLSTEDKEDVAKELVKDFATSAVLVYSDKSYTSLVGSSFPADGVEARKKAQNTFHEHFAVNKQHVIVLEKFDLFPVETLPLFLNLMDHENAEYKDGVLIVTAHTNKSFAEFKFHTEEVLGKFDKFVEDHFFQAWKEKGVQADTIRAVISRLSGSTIMLH